jgi:hypothetical protein
VRDMCVKCALTHARRTIIMACLFGGAMKRPARVPLKLPESLHKRLSAYALAASAVGVGMLAQPAEGRVVYTPADVRVGGRGFNIYRLDLNHDGATDFVLSSFFAFDAELAVCAPGMGSHPCVSNSKGNRVNEIWGYRTAGHSYGWASALRPGARVAANRKHFLSRNIVMAIASCAGSGCLPARGPWNGAATNQYLGFKFRIKGKIHYGWARINVVAPPPNTQITLTGYAYETIAGKPIIAGKTHGKDEATLGRLAQGASGRSDQGKP